MKFSERINVTKVHDVLQVESMTEDLRNSLWNLILRTVFIEGRFDNENHRLITKYLAEYFFKIPVDTLPARDFLQVEWFKELFYGTNMPWWKIYNLIEFLADSSGREEQIYWIEREYFIGEVNRILESEMSGFRFIGGVLAPITSSDELESIQQAVGEAQQRGFCGVRQHLKSAVSLLSQKPTPDYRNSIKESISAVESLSKQITGESSGGLDKALTHLDKTVHFHAAFKAGLLSLYGYTSNDSGIRHAILDEPQVGFDEAKFMLVACSAFVNFIIMKATQAGRSTGSYQSSRS